MKIKYVSRKIMVIIVNLIVSVVASLPVIIIYLIFSRKVVEGMTAGAIKG